MFTKKPSREISPLDIATALPPLPPASQGAGSPIARPLTRGRAGNKSTSSIIDSDLTVIGKLLSKGEVQIDGEVMGDVHVTNISVGENARITGGIVGEKVVVRGTVLGSIRGKRIVLQSSSKVEGAIYYTMLTIDQGAIFEGESHRSEDPTASVAKLDTVAGSGPIS